jgi:hypothetical protein
LLAGAILEYKTKMYNQNHFNSLITHAQPPAWLLEQESWQTHKHWILPHWCRHKGKCILSYFECKKDVKANNLLAYFDNSVVNNASLRLCTKFCFWMKKLARSQKEVSLFNFPMQWRLLLCHLSEPSAVTIITEQGPASLFCEEPARRYFGFCRPGSLCCNYSVLTLLCKINKQRSKAGL